MQVLQVPEQVQQEREPLPEQVLQVFPDAQPVYGTSLECGFITPPMDRQTLAEPFAAVNGRAAYRVLA